MAKEGCQERMQQRPVLVCEGWCGAGRENPQIKLTVFSRLHHPEKDMLVACCQALLSGPLDSLGCLHVLNTPRNLHLRTRRES